MNEIDKIDTQIAEDKNDRRSFFKRIFKYAIGLSTFGVASLFGLKRDGEIRLGKMLDKEQVQELYDSISKSLKELSPEKSHFRTVYESQIYVLEKVLQ